MIHTRNDYNRRIQDAAGIIPKDEPVLLLRSQDALMLPMLQHYLILLRADPKHDKPLEIAVVRLVALVLAWQLAHITKKPNTPLCELESEDPQASTVKEVTKEVLDDMVQELVEHLSGGDIIKEEVLLLYHALTGETRT